MTTLLVILFFVGVMASCWNSVDARDDGHPGQSLFWLLVAVWLSYCIWATL